MNKCKCQKCNHVHDFINKVAFKNTCDKCGNDLHTCKNCKYYHPGKPNDCTVLTALFVRDKERYNFCEDFSPKLPPEKKQERMENLTKKILGEAPPPTKKDGKEAFESLFKN